MGDTDAAKSREVEFAFEANRRSFARLTDESLELLATLGPIVDVGAGNGYWDQVLSNRGVDVVAIEPNRSAHEVYPRIRRDFLAVRDYPDRTLLMIWPTRGSDWPAHCLHVYGGSTFAYVGDPAFEGTASPRLWQVLQAEGWKRTHRLKIGSWPDMPDMFTDMLLIWKRDTT